jgi:hypothetical protein
MEAPSFNKNGASIIVWETGPNTLCLETVVIVSKFFALDTLRHRLRSRKTRDVLTPRSFGRHHI